MIPPFDHNYVLPPYVVTEMENVLNQNLDSPLMKVSLENRIANLRSEIDEMGKVEYHDTTLRLWFGGEAVYGSMGIFSDFASKTLHNML